MCSRFRYRILNARLTGVRGDCKIHVYFNYTHFNVVPIKMRTFVFLNVHVKYRPLLINVHFYDRHLFCSLTAAELSTRFLDR